MSHGARITDGAQSVDIFVSYARVDSLTANAIARLLQDEGWTVFWDQVIPAGETWDTHIGRALAGARCVLVLWTESALSSNWVREEAGEAKKRGTLLPLLIEAVEPPIGFRLYQGLDFTTWQGTPTEPAFAALRTTVERMLAKGEERQTASRGPPIGDDLRQSNERRRTSVEAPVGSTSRRRRVMVGLGVGFFALAGATQLSPRWSILPQATSSNGAARDADKRSGVSAAPRRRFAIVVGIQDYRFLPPLANTVNDAVLIAERLAAIGFVVLREANLKRDAFLSLVRDLGQRIVSADALVVYFAGHGITFDGKTWLYPVDAEVNDIRSATEAAISVDDIVRMSQICSGTTIFLVDTCRSELSWPPAGEPVAVDGARTLTLGPDSDFGRPVETASPAPFPPPNEQLKPDDCQAATGSASGGGTVSTTHNIAITFAAAQGGLAFDGEGSNSPFAEAIAEALLIPGLELHEFFRRVRAKVIADTARQQVPWLNISMDHEFYFNPTD
jgi:hypothetical protein